MPARGADCQIGPAVAVGRLAVRGGGDQAAAADMALIEALANGLQLQRWPGDPETIVELGDLEVTSLLGRRPGGCTFETRDRGTRSIKAVFGTERDARRYLIMKLCEEYRFHWSMRTGHGASGGDAPPMPRTRPIGWPSTRSWPTCAGNAGRRPAPTCSRSPTGIRAGPSPTGSPSSCTSRRAPAATARQRPRSPPPRRRAASC